MVPNAYWAQANWFVDPSNSTGLASDTNSGIDATHPLLTYTEIVRRWETYSPNLAQATTITMMSDQPDFSDPLIFTGTTTNNGSVALNGTLTSVATGTLTAVTAENPSANQRWQVTDASQPAAFWTTYVGYFVHDTTADSWFWVDADSGSSTATVTEPMAAASLSSPAPDIAFLNSARAPQVGDSYVVYALSKAYVARWSPVQNSDNPGQISHLWVTGPNGLGGFDSCQLETYILLFESRCDAFCTSTETVSTNCWFGGGAISRHQFFTGGSVNFYEADGVGSDVYFDGGVCVNGPVEAISGSTTFGFVYWNGTLDVPNPNELGTGFVYIEPFQYSLGQLWGPGGLSTHNLADINYQAPATTSILKSPITGDGATTATAYDPSTGTLIAGIALTAANLDAALPTGFAGVAYLNGGNKIRATF